MVSSESDVLRNEAQALSELAALRRDSVFLAHGLPRGDGRVVVVIPGLFGNDLYLQPLHTWLRRLGYTPVRSTLAVNAGCPNRLREQVEKAIRRAQRAHRGPIALLGHSRGGMLAWALASRLQADASHLMLLGSPAAAVVAMMQTGGAGAPAPASAAVVDAGTRALRLLDPDCTVPDCGCDYPDDLRRALHPETRVFAIYSEDDRIVSPPACVVPGAPSFAVHGTHSGLVYNRAAYPEIARFFASR